MGPVIAVVPNAPSQWPVGTQARSLAAAEVKLAIMDQMSERLAFVKPPEPIVGDILFDYGNLLMRTDTMESAEAIYDLAIAYGAPRAELARKRRDYARSVIKRAKR
jgi:hypothetical protein